MERATRRRVALIQSRVSERLPFRLSPAIFREMTKHDINEAKVRERFGDAYTVLGDCSRLKHPVSLHCHACDADFTVSTFVRLLAGKGCPQCELKARPSRMRGHDAFAAASQAKFGDQYELRSTYAGAKALVSFHCRRCGNNFTNLPRKHLGGRGGCRCGVPAGMQERAKSQWSTFLAKANEKHDGRFTYPALEAEYRNSKRHPVRIVCPEHGEFRQTPYEHLTGLGGCPGCAARLWSSKNTLPLDEWKALAVAKHGDRYDYSQVDYKHKDQDVTIVCPDHGPFPQRPHNHTSVGAGCPKCAFIVTKPCREIAEFINGLGFETEFNDRRVLRPKEIDVWVPGKNFGVEFHGLFWHSERIVGKRAHQNKWLLARKAGVGLMQIFGDEWERQRPLLESMIASRLGVSAVRVHARQCEVVDLTAPEARRFLAAHHLQGFNGAGAYAGLTRAGELVAVASFQTGPEAKVERFAVRPGHHVPGAFSRLLRHFLRGHPEVRSVLTYANGRYSNGNVYAKCGFVEEAVTEPGYFLSDGKVRHPRQKFQAHKLRARGGTGTEREMTAALGFFRIYDAGHVRLRLTI